MGARIYDFSFCFFINARLASQIAVAGIGCGPRSFAAINTPNQRNTCARADRPVVDKDVRPGVPKQHAHIITLVYQHICVHRYTASARAWLTFAMSEEQDVSTALRSTCAIATANVRVTAHTVGIESAKRRVHSIPLR